jgi:hypothetical protein
MKNLYVERAYWLMWFYDEACKRKEKHSAAMEEAVQAYRAKFPGIRVSTTTVRKALAKYRPRGIRRIFLSVPSDPRDQSQERFSAVWRDYMIMRHTLLGFPMPAPDASAPRITFVLDLYAGPRPIYDRYNKKDPKAKRQR